MIETPITPAQESLAAETAPGEARIVAAVFGQILRGDTRVGSHSYEDMLALARPTCGEDPFGYRAEFLNLVRLAGMARAMGER